MLPALRRSYVIFELAIDEDFLWPLALLVADEPVVVLTVRLFGTLASAKKLNSKRMIIKTYLQLLR